MFSFTKEIVLSQKHIQKIYRSMMLSFIQQVLYWKVQIIRVFWQEDQQYDNYYYYFKGLQSLLTGKVNPLTILQQVTSNSKPKYDESHEALNRDACKLMAEHFNNACKEKGQKGHFVFISASRSIAPMLSRYAEMKEQAENFLLNNCPEIQPVILRPGFVWHQNERGWSQPVRLVTDFGYEVNKKIIKNIPGNEAVQSLLPQNKSINLRVLTDFAIQGALGELDELNKEHIWTNEKMNDYAKV